MKKQTNQEQIFNNLVLAVDQGLYVNFITNLAELDPKNLNNFHNNKPILHIAIQKHLHQFAETLLRKQANARLGDRENGYTAFHSCIIHDNEHIFEELIKTGNYDLYAKTKEGDIAIHISAEFNRLKYMKKIYALNKDIYQVTKEGMNAFHIAAIKGFIDILIYLNSINSELINSSDNEGNTALHQAAFHENSLLIEFLLQNKANLNAKNNNGDTALQLAVKLRRDLKIIRLLLRYKPNLALTDKYDYNVTQNAIEKKYIDAELLLRRHGGIYNANHNLYHEISVVTLNRTLKLLSDNQMKLSIYIDEVLLAGHAITYREMIFKVLYFQDPEDTTKFEETLFENLQKAFDSKFSAILLEAFALINFKHIIQKQKQKKIIYCKGQSTNSIKVHTHASESGRTNAKHTILVAFEKDPLETTIHEIGHDVMMDVFDNDFAPNFANDHATKKHFDNAMAHLRSLRDKENDFDENVEYVFNSFLSIFSYKEKRHNSELIVRFLETHLHMNLAGIHSHYIYHVYEELVPGLYDFIENNLLPIISNRSKLQALGYENAGLLKPTSEVNKPLSQNKNKILAKDNCFC